MPLLTYKNHIIVFQALLFRTIFWGNFVGNIPETGAFFNRRRGEWSSGKRARLPYTGQRSTWFTVNLERLNGDSFDKCVIIFDVANFHQIWTKTSTRPPPVMWEGTCAAWAAYQLLTGGGHGENVTRPQLVGYLEVGKCPLTLCVQLGLSLIN